MSMIPAGFTPLFRSSAFLDLLGPIYNQRSDTGLVIVIGLVKLHRQQTHFQIIAPVEGAMTYQRAAPFEQTGEQPHACAETDDALLTRCSAQQQNGGPHVLGATQQCLGLLCHRAPVGQRVLRVHITGLGLIEPGRGLGAAFHQQAAIVMAAHVILQKGDAAPIIGVHRPGEIEAHLLVDLVRGPAPTCPIRHFAALNGSMAQMLASVMFDLRPIGGTASLYTDLQAEVLDMAAKNSIFVAHMISNSLKHTPPLGLLRGFATIRSGEHKNTIDLKHNGVVPVTDLGRVYALIGQLPAVNTRARLEAAAEAGVISSSGARDLLEAYDLIAETRLQHQLRRVKAGHKPDNFIAPSDLSDFERSHLRDAFVVVRTMQSAIGSTRGARS